MVIPNIGRITGKRSPIRLPEYPNIVVTSAPEMVKKVSIFYVFSSVELSSFAPVTDAKIPSPIKIPIANKNRILKSSNKEPVQVNAPVTKFAGSVIADKRKNIKVDRAPEIRAFYVGATRAFIPQPAYC
jgi:hypothetical protein